MGDFYYEVGVQVVELCVATSHRNGGVLSLDEVQRRLNARRRLDNQITRLFRIALTVLIRISLTVSHIYLFYDFLKLGFRVLENIKLPKTLQLPWQQK